MSFNDSDLKKQPLVSIVLPTFNGEAWLREAIVSILNQSFEDWELIIVNDCSTDSTLKISMDFSQKDSRIRVVSNEANQKLPESLNIGFKLARGEYLTWTSDDNLLKPNALQKLVSYLDDNPEVDLISMNFDFIDEKGDIIGYFQEGHPFMRNAAYLLIGCNVGAAFMYRRRIADRVGAYDRTLFCGEDYDYWCRIALAGKIAYMADNVYQYRKNQIALTVTNKKNLDKNTRLIQKKYAEAFFDRYKYTKIDRLKFWFNTSVLDSPLRYFPGILCILLYVILFKVVLLPFLLNKNVRKYLKSKFAFYKRYSFSVPRE